MTLPANLATGRITGTLLDTATGAPLSGTVVFTPNTQVVINPAGLTLHAAKQRDVKLAKDGSFTVDLIATDSPNIQPAEWSWRVEFRTSPPLPGFSFSIASGSVQDISQLSPVPESGGTFSAFNIPAELVEQSKVAAENAAAAANSLASTATNAATSADTAAQAALAAQQAAEDAAARAGQITGVSVTADGTPYLDSTGTAVIAVTADGTPYIY